MKSLRLAQIYRVFPGSRFLALGVIAAIIGMGIGCAVKTDSRPVLSSSVKAATPPTGWPVIDQYRLGTPALLNSAISVSTAVSSDGLATLTAGTAEDDPGSLHWIVRKTASLVANATVTVDDFQYVAGWDCTASAVTLDASRIYYAVGSGLDASGILHWLVRSTVTAGGAWTTIDDFQLQAGYNSAATSLAVDSTGVIYVAGFGADSTGTQHWVVRKKPVGGAWQLMNSYQLTGAKDSLALAVAYDSSHGILYVGGYAETGAGKEWMVRKFDGAVWSTVDTFQFSSPYDTQALALAVNVFGDVYVTGHGQDATGIPHALTRVLRYGSTWTTVDDYQYAVGKSAYSRGVSLTSGIAYTAGYAVDSTGSSRWTIRSESSQGSWGVHEEEQSTAGNSIFACSIGADTRGHIVVTGLDTATFPWLLKVGN